MDNNWSKELPIAITVTNKEGIIVEMNDRSVGTFAKYGGTDLIGQPLNNCHNPKSQEIIAELSEKKTTNVYTIEKNGVKKLFFQSPWFNNGEYAGLVELSMIIREDMTHYIR